MASAANDQNDSWQFVERRGRVIIVSDMGAEFDLGPAEQAKDRLADFLMESDGAKG